MASTFHLLVAIPDKEPISYSLSGEKVSLGRSPVNDIQILVREVSTTHCEFHRSDSGYEITDLGSTNGTKVNDQSVKNGKIGVNHRDMILLGETIPAYIVVAEEGASIDMKGEIAQIERARAVPRTPTVQHLKAPGVAKKVALPTKKPLVSAPAKPPTPVEPGKVGSATIKLDQVRPGQPVTPPVKKLAPPGGAKPLPALTKKPAPAPLAPEKAPPAVKVAPPGGPPAVKLAPPGAPGQPPKKLGLPPRKGAPKLNLPEKED